MRESLFLLLAAGGNNDLVPESQEVGGATGLGYADFEALRPEYASSSWRGILNRLVEQRYVLKRLAGDRVTFQLTRLGEEWLLQNVFSGFLTAQEDRMSLVLLRPRSNRKQAYGRARRLLEERGYQSVIPGVYVTQTGSYSDLLWQSLHDAGFVSVFLRVPVDVARPIRLSEFFAPIEDQTAPQRQWKKLSNNLEELLAITIDEKELRPAHKKQIGEAVVSGLELTARWTPFWAAEGLTQAQIQTVLAQIFRLMRQFQEITT